MNNLVNLYVDEDLKSFITNVKSRVVQQKIVIRMSTPKGDVDIKAEDLPTKQQQLNKLIREYYEEEDTLA